ncbi:MAG: gamma-glutamyl-gamma-aminobutyrate hydrolase family protein [Bacillota bacterium]|nr:gamma-glutamyl-gamma-aminobutyrate hydrolase family protein [Bacillota bacterium]
MIGLTSSFSAENNSQALPSTYVAAIEQAGGIPLIIPAGISPALSDAILQRIDGLLLTGGPDVDPSYFGEGPHPRLGAVTPERDVIEIPLTQAAVACRLPILAICRGIQLLNIAMGGSVIQDIASQVKDPLKHRQEAPRWHGTHEVAVAEGSRLAGLLGTTCVRVNTFHHQAVKDVAPGFEIVARAPDGVIEGIERPGSFIVGVQWHPEGMYERVPEMARLFRGYIEAVAAARAAGTAMAIGTAKATGATPACAAGAADATKAVGAR